eukprot:4426029-Pyramimonas_sp.AAC.1
MLHGQCLAAGSAAETGSNGRATYFLLLRFPVLFVAMGPKPSQNSNSACAPALRAPTIFELPKARRPMLRGAMARGLEGEGEPIPVGQSRRAKTLAGMGKGGQGSPHGGARGGGQGQLAGSDRDEMKALQKLTLRSSAAVRQLANEVGDFWLQSMASVAV